MFNVFLMGIPKWGDKVPQVEGVVINLFNNREQLETENQANIVPRTCFPMIRIAASWRLKTTSGKGVPILLRI